MELYKNKFNNQYKFSKITAEHKYSLSTNASNTIRLLKIANQYNFIYIKIPYVIIPKLIIILYLYSY